MAQAEALDDMLAEIDRPLDVVFVLQVPDDVARERLAKRASRGGPRRRHAGRDRHAGSRRTTARRSRSSSTTAPGGNLVGIHGTGTVEEVFRQIQDALEQVAVRQMIIRKSEREIELIAAAGRVVADTIAHVGRSHRARA